MSAIIPIEDKTICVMGLGYVGLTLAVTMADVGFEVYGIEIRDSVLNLLESGKAPFHEPGLEARIRKVIAKKRFHFMKKIPTDVPINVFIITVGTPLGEDGISRMDMITNVTSEVASHMKDGNLIIMRSTVKLGVTRNLVQPILDKVEAKYSLAFCPERTLEGKAIQELRVLPQIVGGIDEKSAIRAEQIFQQLTPTVVRVSNPETAEMIKLIDNTARDVLFAFSNEVASICNQTNVLASEVIRAGKLGYPRTNLPMPGPVGGPCLEKDPHILIESLKGLNVVTRITAAARTTNENQPAEVTAFLEQRYGACGGKSQGPIKIVILGLAFKGRPATDDLRGTMARHMLRCLCEKFSGAKFFGFDAVVPHAEIQAMGLEVSQNLEEAFQGTSIAVIMNNHPVFESMNIETLAESMALPAIIYDFWNNFNPKDLELPQGVEYTPLGGHEYSSRHYAT